MAMPKTFEDLYANVGVQATTQAFDEAKGVQGRIGSITSAGSPLMTAARTRAKQAGARAGLLNSSLAGQAGEKAVLDTAMPIATADAQLYQSQALANQQAMNNAALATASNRMNVGLAKFNMDENIRQFDANLGENRRQFDTGLSWDKEKTGQALNEQRRQFDSRLGLDQQSLAEQTRQFDASFGQNAQQFSEKLALERENLAAQREQFAQKLGLDVQQLNLQRDQLGQQDRQFLAELDQKDRQLNQQADQFRQEMANRVTLANRDAENRENLMGLEAKYKQAIAGNENISRAWGSMMDSISQIQNNPDIKSDAKATLISNVQAGFASFAKFWEGTSGVDVSSLLNFAPAERAPETSSEAVRRQNPWLQGRPGFDNQQGEGA